ncbi:Doublecortin domain-containing protein 2 [Stylophora pistillata]|uniref:Doublecortin domain-containing protein 2 n=1 Tax=Stylophora pistillata TaxID=50429 RepID=A0A2B4RLG0_STYPI|nr:Doublecortin domain-containing protein 2 [Stylophora pistillata]
MMGKPVFVHLNGDSFKRKRIVVNNRDMRSFESFLNTVAASFRTPAREIRTPGGRHRIRTLDDLQRDCTYVVKGREPFKKIGYDVKDSRPHRLPPLKGPEGGIMFDDYSVFCNGVVAKPKRVQLRTDFKMFQVLESVNDKVSSVSKNGAVYDLFTIDGQKISEPSQLNDCGQYVAVGRERFFDRSVTYSDQGVATQLTPRSMYWVVRPRSEAPVCGVNKKKRQDTVQVNSVPPYMTARNEPEPFSPFDSFKDTLAESLRDDEPVRRHEMERNDSPHESEVEDIPLEEALQNQVADVLGDNGVPVDNFVYDRKDSSANGKPSVYEASGENKEDAREIQDERETIEDKPIDQMPAEEVADEEIEDENHPNPDTSTDEVHNEEERDEVEENVQTKDYDNERDQPEASEQIEPNDTNESIEPQEQLQPKDTYEPQEEITTTENSEAQEEIVTTENNEPQGFNQPVDHNEPKNDHEPQETVQ